MAEFIFDLQLFADDTEDTTDTTDDTEDISGTSAGSSIGDGDGDGGDGGSSTGDNGGSSSSGSGNDNSSDSSTGGSNVPKVPQEADTGNIRVDQETGNRVANTGAKSSDSPYSGGSGSSEQSGIYISGGTGWDPRIRKQGEILFPMFMSNATANAFAEAAYDVFITALNQDAVPYYDIRDGIADSFDYSRLLMGSVILDNDTYDTINLVDSNVGNLIKSYTYSSGDILSLVFDTGAVLVFDIDQISPWFNFANGENMLYSKRAGQWVSGNEAESEFVFWNTAVQYSGDDADNFAVTQGTNTAILDAGSSDTINLYDVTSSDVSYSVSADNYTINLDSTEVTDSYITVYFPTGGALVVENSSDYSPIFNLADGTSYYYNRNRDEWRGATWDTIAALEASDAEVDAYNKAIAAAYEKAVFEQALYESGYDVVYEADEKDAAGNYVYSDVFPLSIGNNNYVYDAGYYDKIYFADAVFANLVDYSADGAYLNFTFANGTTTTVEFDYNFSPIISFADGTQIAYDYYTETWGTPYYATPDVTIDGETQTIAEEVTLSRGANSIVYQAGGEDTIYFADALPANILSSNTGDWYINIFFDTGAVANVRYTDYSTPDFVFADGSRYYYNSNEWITVYTSTADVQDNFAVSSNSANAIRSAGAEDSVIFADATLANVRDINVDQNGYYVNFTFDTGETTRVYYTDMATPDFVFADGSRYYYSFSSDAWGTYDAEGSVVSAPILTGFVDVAETFSGSVYTPGFFYHTSSNDDISFSDATAANVLNVQTNDYLVDVTFNTGATTRVGYTGTFTPDFVFADGTRYYYSLNTDSWTSYLSSADTASDDLWGDTFSGTAAADEIFVGTVGNTLVQNVDAQDSVTFDATLSDIVATSVSDNTIAIAFGTGATAVIETAGTSPTFNLASGESYIYDKQSASWKTA